jgi:hypothetical protein
MVLGCENASTTGPKKQPGTPAPTSPAAVHAPGGEKAKDGAEKPKDEKAKDGEKK